MVQKVMRVSPLMVTRNAQRFRLGSLDVLQITWGDAPKSSFDNLAEEFSTTDKTSAPVNAKLATMIEELIKGNLPKTNLEELVEKYPRPENANCYSPQKWIELFEISCLRLPNPQKGLFRKLNSYLFYKSMPLSMHVKSIR